MQTPSEFLREQVTTVREKVDQVASNVAESVADAPSVAAVSSQVGDFIREQRSAARVSLRELARTAGVSNPYLSQVERGLRKPSAEILASIARGLKISAESLYVRAGILEPDQDVVVSVVDAVHRDPYLSGEQKQTLLRVYESLRAQAAERGSSTEPAGA